MTAEIYFVLNKGSPIKFAGKFAAFVYRRDAERVAGQLGLELGKSLTVASACRTTLWSDQDFSLL